MQKVELMAETIKTFQVAQIGEYIIKRVIVEISKRSLYFFCCPEPPKIAIYWLQVHKFDVATFR